MTEPKLSSPDPTPDPPHMDPVIAELMQLSPDQLEAKRREIVGSAGGDYKSLSEEDLCKLAYITSTLRRRSSGPPKVAKDKTPGAKKAKPTLDDLGGLL